MNTFQKSYNPNRSSDWNYGGSKWKLSRSKIDLFLECPRCFYIDNKLGTKRPSFPSFTLNVAVDELLKKEFNKHREKATVHPLLEEHGLSYVPFPHKDLEIWRDNFAGITYTDQETGFIISGAIDDVWVDDADSLIIVDYKATSKEGHITELGHSPWEEQYARQLSVYRWLFMQNGFTARETAYLIYANASKEENAFNNTLVFETTLIPVKTDVSWIPSTLEQIKTVLTADTIPPSGSSCEYCPYREAAGKKLLAIHNATRKS